MKSGKEVCLTSNNKNFKIITGAVENYKSPISVYINITSWLTVTKKVKDVNSLIKEYRWIVRQFLKNNSYVKEYFTVNNIVDLRINPTGIRGKKPTFFELEINLYQSGELYPLVKPKHSNIKDLKPILQKIVNDLIILPIFVENSNFEFQLTKIIKDCEEQGIC